MFGSGYSVVAAAGRGAAPAVVASTAGGRAAAVVAARRGVAARGRRGASVVIATTPGRSLFVVALPPDAGFFVGPSLRFTPPPLFFGADAGVVPLFGVSHGAIHLNTGLLDARSHPEVVRRATDTRGAPEGDVQLLAGLANPAFGFVPVAILFAGETLDLGLGGLGVFAPLDRVFGVDRGALEEGARRLGVLLRARGLLALEHLLRFLEGTLAVPEDGVVGRDLVFGLLHARVHLLRVRDAL